MLVTKLVPTAGRRISAQSFRPVAGGLVAARSYASSAEVAENAQDQILYDVAPNGIATMTLNRPKQGNAIRWEMYDQTSAMLRDADQDPRVKCLVLRGTGRFLSTGADVNQASEPDGLLYSAAKYDGTPGEAYHHARSTIANGSAKMARAFGNFSKPLICGMNGPVIGIMAAVLGTFDMIYATRSAYMSAPFMKLGLAPEGTSSFTFPRIMGRQIAGDVLLAGKIMTAEEMHQAGMVSRVFDDDKFEEELKKITDRIAEYPTDSLVHGKQLLNIGYREGMNKANDEETTVLAGRFVSGDPARAFDAMAQELAKKRKGE
eukprot:Clim_evm38s235 gene=Clim_evmTU38s235